ncbi:nucleotidyltransferase family protein [Roseovarius sp. CAU 1744]|uniref:nucleotidyltransferase family protein n=1 Tax=Roseovarius sp. CAU 1744 TaxID=3140368 RepID=UPI00325A853C
MLILIPAAGASSRMRGRDKLLELVDKHPLLARQIGIALQTPATVLVTLPPDARDRTAIVEGIVDDRLEALIVDDAEEGLAASLRAAVRFAAKQEHDPEALMILLADMPEIEAADLHRLMQAFDGKTVVRATDADGRVGHPVIIPPRLFPDLDGLSGDQGARRALDGEHIITVPLAGHRATTDLDTPEDWAAWRRKTGR